MRMIDFVNALKLLDQNSIVVGVDIEQYGSYRGSYDEFFIGINADKSCLVSELLQIVESSIGKKFTGYKGGSFVMNEYTTINYSLPSSLGYEIIGIMTGYSYGHHDIVHKILINKEVDLISCY